MQHKEHLLIIRLSAMGDVAMTVPVIKSLVKQYPKLKITLVSKPFLEPLFEEIDNLTFFKADVNGRHKGFIGLFRLYKDTKKLGITKVADLHNVLRSKIISLFYTLSFTPVKTIDKGRAEKKALTREHNKVFKQLKTSFERYADVFSKLGFDFSLQPVVKNEKPLHKSVINISGSKESNWIGFAPFAAFSGKTYPINLTKEVISKLAEKPSKILLLGGGKKEVNLLEEMATPYANVINIAGKLSFKEELALISNLDLMLAMDSGNAHLAAIMGIKTVTLWGVTHPYAGFAPYGQPFDFCLLPDLKQYPKTPCSVYGNKVFEGYENIMATIKPETIVNKIEDVLS